MQEQKFRELEDRSSTEMLIRAERADLIKNLEARAHVQDVIKSMKAEGKAFELTDEEEKMLLSFRRFKLRMRKDGEVFTWQSRRPEGVQLAAETAEIVHPGEV
jgi:hypothetical protein